MAVTNFTIIQTGFFSVPEFSLEDVVQWNVLLDEGLFGHHHNGQG
jgi:hypothetical protein